MGLELRLLAHFCAAHPAEAAAMLEGMPPEKAAASLRDLSPREAAALLKWLPAFGAARALAELPEEVALAILQAARRDQAASVLRLTAPARRQALLKRMSPAQRAVLGHLLQYAEDTAGALMDPDVLSMSGSFTVAEALTRYRAEADAARYYLYVVGEEQRLTGVVSVRTLMRSPDDARLLAVSDRDVESIAARSSWQSVLDHPAWSRVHALPVVDAGRRFIGVIRYETVRALERRHAAQSIEDAGGRTVAALGEIYGLGLRSALQWATSLSLAPSDKEADRRRADGGESRDQ